jgi:uncharacterized protein (TIGR03086 family)
VLPQQICLTHPPGAAVGLRRTRHSRPLPSRFMSTDTERYELVASDFTARLGQVGTDQWSNPTPCSEWTVRDLVAHVITTQRRVLAMLGGEAAEVDPDSDLPAAWASASTELLAAASDPAKAATQVTTFGGREVAFETVVGGLVCSDTVIHTWDLARATGQDEQLDPGAVEHCAVMLAGIGDSMRRPGGFSEALPPPPEADAQTKFLLFAGRAV